MLVLVVDDNPEIRAVVAYELRSHGFDVLEAEDGERAFAMLHQHPVAAIVSDVQMPRMGGEALLKLVREGRPEIPVFLMTGGSALTAGEARALGAVQLFCKTDLRNLVPALMQEVAA